LILSQFQAVLSDDEKWATEALLSLVAAYPGASGSRLQSVQRSRWSARIVASKSKLLESSGARFAEKRATPNRESVMVPYRAAQIPFM